MPTSSKAFDARISDLLRSINPARVLDVGAGSGKYGKLVRQTCGDAVETTALEIDKGYPEAYDLIRHYRDVLTESVVGFFDVHGREALTFDLIIAGDVLQNMKKSDGVDCLHEWCRRAEHVIVVVPLDICQIIPGAPHESFRSFWGAVDFEYWLPEIEIQPIPDGRFKGCRQMYVHIKNEKPEIT